MTVELLTPDAVDRAVEVLDAGGVLGVPTDTVYGLAARLADPRALEDRKSVV
jgi:L-threonylcarbamoyladenylate synthase